MRVLLVSATKLEIEPLLHWANGMFSFSHKNHHIDILITGVGMVATAFYLGKQITKHQYDMAVNMGIAGSFDRDLELGEVIAVNEDCFAELGAEDGEEFLPIDKLGFGESIAKPVISVPISDLKTVKAITVSRVHGNETTIYNTMSRLQPQIESMEGAAFYYCCNQCNTPSVQIRAISNYVERRNLSNWNIKLAVENLNKVVINWLEEL